MKDHYGCNKAKKMRLHKRVACCQTCHNWDELEDWTGYLFTLPDGEEVWVCCEVGDELAKKHLGRFYVGA